MKKNNQKQSAIDFSRYERLHVCLRIAYNGATYDGLAIQDQTQNTIEEVFLRACVKLRLIPDMFMINRPSASSSSTTDNAAAEQQHVPFTFGVPHDDDDDDGANNNKKNIWTGTAEEWIKFSRCGRTDKGVSAMGNAISLYMRGASSSSSSSTSTARPLYDKLLNKVLPSSIRVIGYVAGVPDSFNARFSCRARSYRYFFDGFKLNLAKMKKAASLLVGKHDYRNLCHMDVIAVSNFVREVHTAKIRDAETGQEVSDDDIVNDHNHKMFFLDIRANAFLYHQIRCIMTILLSVGAELEEPRIVTDLLYKVVDDGVGDDDEQEHKNKNVPNNSKFERKPFYPLADPAPLLLWNCEYDWDSLMMKKADDGNNGDDSAVSSSSSSWWKFDEQTMNTYIQELDFEMNAARIRDVACVSMKNMIVNEFFNNKKSNNSNDDDSSSQQQQHPRRTTTTAYLFQNNTSSVYIPLEKRDREKSYEEKIAALSERGKEKWSINNEKKKQSGTRREREN